MSNTLKGSNSQKTKELNRALILKLISTKSPISRIELSKLTELSKMSVTNIVNELLEKNMVIELGELPEDYIPEISAGRTPILLVPNPKAFLAIGVYISRDFCEAAIMNIKGDICAYTKVEFASEETKDSFLDKVISQINSVLHLGHTDISQIIGIGIASIGPLDLKEGVILAPPNFHDLPNIPICDIISKIYPCPVYMNNDMNASAIGEKYFGCCKENADFVYVGITNGIGAGIITNNQLFIGHNGFSGEFGHTTIQMDGPTCVCGNSGCLEMYANIPEVIRQFKSAKELGLSTTLTDPPTWQEIINHGRSGDELCAKLIQRLASYISIGLINLVNLFDPEAIILGHEIALAGDLILPYLREEVNKRIFSSKHMRVEILMSNYIDKAPLIGSASLVFEKMFVGEISV